MQRKKSEYMKEEQIYTQINERQTKSLMNETMANKWSSIQSTFRIMQ